MQSQRSKHKSLFVKLACLFILTRASLRAVKFYVTLSFSTESLFYTHWSLLKSNKVLCHFLSFLTESYFYTHSTLFESNEVLCHFLSFSTELPFYTHPSFFESGEVLCHFLSFLAESPFYTHSTLLESSKVLCHFFSFLTKSPFYTHPSLFKSDEVLYYFFSIESHGMNHTVFLTLSLSFFSFSKHLFMARPIFLSLSFFSPTRDGKTEKEGIWSHTPIYAWWQHFMSIHD